MEVPDADLGPFAKTEVDMGFTKKFLGTTSKQIKASNSFNSLVAESSTTDLQDQPKELEEGYEYDDTIPSKEECYATPKLKTTRKENRRQN
mgnify:CR=1 FL=1